MARRTAKWMWWKWMNVYTDTSYTKIAIHRLRILKTPYFSIFWHHILNPDSQPDPHDHPWNFWSLVIHGGYREELWLAEPPLRRRNPVWRTWLPGTLHYMPITAAHRIRQVSPGTVTLVLTGRRQRDWGFWTQAGFVNRQDYQFSGYPAPSNPLDM
jgi:hypothetical protein